MAPWPEVPPAHDLLTLALCGIKLIAPDVNNKISHPIKKLSYPILLDLNNI